LNVESRDDEFRHGGGVTTTEMAVGKYRKRLLQSCAIGMVLGAVGIEILRLTYMQILQELVRASIANWWLIPSIVVLVGLAVIINRPRRKRARQRAKQEVQKQSEKQ
jgi:cbb3-type cytochrome oxidase subunit 3